MSSILAADTRAVSDLIALGVLLGTAIVLALALGVIMLLSGPL